jgi:hypothetical protein
MKNMHLPYDGFVEKPKHVTLFVQLKILSENVVVFDGVCQF